MCSNCLLRWVIEGIPSRKAWRACPSTVKNNCEGPGVKLIFTGEIETPNNEKSERNQALTTMKDCLRLLQKIPLGFGTCSLNRTIKNNTGHSDQTKPGLMLAFTVSTSPKKQVNSGRLRLPAAQNLSFRGSAPRQVQWVFLCPVFSYTYIIFNFVV